MMTNTNDNTPDNDATMPTGPLTSADDPRMLAYLLGELDDADRTHVDSYIANTPDASAELDELRAMLGLLETEIATDGTPPKLHTAQRDEILAAANAPVNEVAKAASAGGGSSSIWLRMAASIAATVGLGWLAYEFIEGSEPPPHASIEEASSEAIAMNDTSPMDRIRELNVRGDGAANEEPSVDVRRMLEEVGYVKSSELRALGYLSDDADDAFAEPMLESLSYVDDASGDEQSEDFASLLQAMGYIDQDSVATVDPKGGRGAGSAARSSPSVGTPATTERAAELRDGEENDAAAFFAGGRYYLDGDSGERQGLNVNGGYDVGGHGEFALQAPDEAVDEESVSAGTQPSVAGGGSSGLSARGRSGKRLEAELPAELSPKIAKKGVATPTPTAPTKPAPNTVSEDVTPEMAAQLQALGYVSSDPVARSGDDAFALRFAPPFTPTERERRELEADIRVRSIQREGYAPVHENPFVSPRDPRHARSTFGLDVDTASYANMRRFLNDGRLPPPAAIRIEELVNYFDYDTSWADELLDEAESPIAMRVDGAWCPWALDHRLVRLQMKAVEPDERPAANLVFLVDVSGSMKPDDRLPLLKSAMRLLVSTLYANDRVAIVTYNDKSGTTLESTTCDRKDVILRALDSLRAGGSTNGEAGLRQAYKVASQHFIDGGVNRVILASDGDFNVGAQSRDELYSLITQQAQSNVFLTVLGFGTDNLQDSNLELLADKGNGHYAYIDSLAEGEKVLMKEAGATLQTVAKDVKIQVEFNPAKVQAYRLLGYENRALAAKDFNDDRKDAGDVGAGHTVTALYEVIPTGAGWQPDVDELKYQTPAAEPEPDVVVSDSPEMLTVKLRYKQPDADTSQLMELPFVDQVISINARSLYDMLGMDDDFRLATAVASFGMIMRGSVHAGTASFDDVVALAESIRSDDPRGYRAEFIRLVRMAKGLSAR